MKTCIYLDTILKKYIFNKGGKAENIFYYEQVYDLGCLYEVSIYCNFPVS